METTSLKTIRKSRKMTQRQVAVKMGVDPTVVSKLEKDHSKAQLDTIKRYLSALGAKTVAVAFTFEHGTVEISLKHNGK